MVTGIDDVFVLVSVFIEITIGPICAQGQLKCLTSFSNQPHCGALAASFTEKLGVKRLAQWHLIQGGRWSPKGSPKTRMCWGTFWLPGGHSSSHYSLRAFVNSLLFVSLRRRFFKFEGTDRLMAGYRTSQTSEDLPSRASDEVRLRRESLVTAMAIMITMMTTVVMSTSTRSLAWLTMQTGVPT